MTPADHVFALESGEDWSAAGDTPLWSQWTEPEFPLAMLVVEELEDSGDIVDVDLQRDVEHLPWPTGSDRIRFQALAEQWERETEFLSLQAKAIVHPAYLKVIGMGPVAVPLILERLEAKGGHWFAALVAITDTDAASGVTTYDAARQAWLDWGRQHGYLRP